MHAEEGLLYKQRPDTEVHGGFTEAHGGFNAGNSSAHLRETSAYLRVPLVAPIAALHVFRRSLRRAMPRVRYFPPPSPNVAPTLSVDAPAPTSA